MTPLNLLPLAVLAFLCFGGVSLWLGQDANWDLKNYHFYNPYAFLNGRLVVDHNAADIQTFFNPSLDLLTTYPLIKLFGPLGFSFVLGGIHGLAFFLLVAISLEIFPALASLSGKAIWGLSLLTACLGMTGALAFSQIGTTFGDLTLSVLNLCSLWLILRANKLPWCSAMICLLAVGGLLIGLSAGFKLVNVIYLLGLLSAVLLSWPQRRRAAFVIVGSCAAVGFVLAHGWWSLRLYQLYGNPMFPLFNTVFQSPYFPLVNRIDARFFPEGWLQQLFYPFFFSWNHQTAEIAFRDFRFPLAYLCLLVLLFRVLRDKPGRDGGLFMPGGGGLIVVFVVSSYLFWQVGFSIQRYAVTIELLLPVIIAMTLLMTVPRHALHGFLGIFALLALTTSHCYWGRIDLDRGPFYAIHDARLPEVKKALSHAAIILGSPPLAYLVPAFDLPDSSWIFGSFNAVDRQGALNKLKSKSSVFLVTRTTGPDLQAANSILEQYRLPKVAGEKCRLFSTNADAGLLLCVVVDGGTSQSDLFAERNALSGRVHAEGG